MSDATTATDGSPLIAETQHSFVFFSTLLDKPVHDANGVSVGRLSGRAR